MTKLHSFRLQILNLGTSTLIGPLGRYAEPNELRHSINLNTVLILIIGILIDKQSIEDHMEQGMHRQVGDGV